MIALLAAYNERRFIEPCLSHLRANGVDAYLIDNCSTDNTVQLAERWLGRGLIGMESFPRGEDDRYRWARLLARKEQLSGELDADWFIHMDPDELRLPPSADVSLAEALDEVAGRGFNAVDFMEFTFIPTREEPDHDHGRFRQTLRTYYPFRPRSPHRLNAWRAGVDVDLVHSGGHAVRFPGMRPFPEAFPMRHYLFLSIDHAVEKYSERRYDPTEVELGWHGWRARLDSSDLRLPRAAELRVARTDYDLDPSEPRTRHHTEEMASAGK